MSYVNLNPIQADLSTTPQKSDFTSVQQRIRAVCHQEEPSGHAPGPSLLPFAGHEHLDAPNELPFRLDDYLDLLGWSGRVIRKDKKGAIPEGIPPILERLNIDSDMWLQTLQRGRRLPFHNMIGRPAQIREAAISYGREFFKGLQFAQQLFPDPGWLRPGIRRIDRSAVPENGRPCLNDGLSRRISNEPALS